MSIDNGLPAPRDASGWLKSAQAYVAFFSACIGVIAALQSSISRGEADRAADKAAAFKQQLEEKANQRAERESRVHSDAMAYEAVVKVLVDTADKSALVQEKRQKAAIALVLATASDGMKTALLDVLKTSPSVDAKLRADVERTVDIIATEGMEAAGADVPASNPARPAPGSQQAPADALSGYRVVIFYCQSSADPAAAQRQAQLAETLRSELSADAALRSVRFETKELPEVLNASPGYRIYSNQIRYNPQDNEQRSSEALKALVEKTGAASTGKLQFERVVVSKRTPSYLSVFVCGRRAA